MAMYDAYEEEQRPVFTGKSVHNQRVERNNRDLNVAITSPFKSVFQELQLEGNLDVDNETDMFCLHYIYLPRINQALTNHKNAHNHHKLSTEGSATPLQLYTVNIPLQTSHDSQVRNSVQDHVLPDLPETSVVTVPKIHCPLSVESFQLLEATINPLSVSVCNAKDLYGMYVLYCEKCHWDNFDIKFCDVVDSITVYPF